MYTKSDKKALDVGLHERPLVAVDAVSLTLRDQALQVLLWRPQWRPQKAKWILPGGLVSPEETLEDAVLRTLEEETGLADVYLEQLYTFGEPHRVPGHRVITVAYLVLIPAVAVAPGTVDGTDRVRWWSVYDLPPLAFDHAQILSYALARLRCKLESTPVGFKFLPQEFTLTQLQTTYEIVLGKTLDKRNFRRKILGAGIIEPSGGYRTGEGRPACLYRYRDDAIAEVQARMRSTAAWR
jgi:8-oxo-dGTP diphosphatase